MTEQTRLQRSKQSDTAFTQSSHSTSQGTQLFVDNSSRVTAQSELLDTLTAPSTNLVQRVGKNKNEQKPEYLDLSEKPWFPEGSIRGDQIEVPDGAPQLPEVNVNHGGYQVNWNRPSKMKNPLIEKAEGFAEKLGDLDPRGTGTIIKLGMAGYKLLYSGWRPKFLNNDKK